MVQNIKRIGKEILGEWIDRKCGLLGNRNAVLWETGHEIQPRDRS